MHLHKRYKNGGSVETTEGVKETSEGMSGQNPSKLAAFFKTLDRQSQDSFLDAVGISQHDMYAMLDYPGRQTTTQRLSSLTLDPASRQMHPLVGENPSALALKERASEPYGGLKLPSDLSESERKALMMKYDPFMQRWRESVRNR